MKEADYQQHQQHQQDDDVKQYLPTREENTVSFQSLSSRSLNVIVDNFNELVLRKRKQSDNDTMNINNNNSSSSSSIQPKLFIEILKSLPYDKIEHYIGADFVHNEDFWKRAAIQRFGNGKCIIESHGLSWKRLYYEIYLSDLISRGLLIGEEEVEAGGGHGENDDVLETAHSVKDYIFTLTINSNERGISCPCNGKELLLSNLFKALPNLTTLKICNDFKKSSSTKGDISISRKEIRQFGKALQEINCLCSLILSNCGLDDDLIRLLLLGMDEEENNEGESLRKDIRNTLVHLDLSHNAIATDGLRLILDHFLSPNERYNNPILSTLNVSNNSIRTEGGRSIGRILRTNSSLISLDISLNRLQDEGGELLIQGLRQNCTLRCLNLASNELGSKSISILSKVLEEDDPSSSLLESNHICISELKEIDLSSNCLIEEDIVQLSKAIQINKKLVCLDLRCQAMNDDENPPPDHLIEHAITSINEKLLINQNGRFCK